jgi:hypothetical protein
MKSLIKQVSKRQNNDNTCFYGDVYICLIQIERIQLQDCILRVSYDILYVSGIKYYITIIAWFVSSTERDINYPQYNVTSDVIGHPEIVLYSTTYKWCFIYHQGRK